MLQWFREHSIGWEIFVPAVVVYALAAALLERRARPGLVPYAFLACWVGAMVGAYAVNHVNAMRLRNVGLWVAMSLTVVVITLVPLGLTQLGARVAGSRRIGAGRWVIGGAIGLLLLPLTNLLSAGIADVVLPRIVH